MKDGKLSTSTAKVEFSVEIREASTFNVKKWLKTQF